MSKKVNELFFDNIDTPNKAYCLGLIASDGYINKDRNKITLTSKDYEMIFNFKNLIGSEHKISKNEYFDKRTKKTYHRYTIQVASKRLVEGIERHGIHNKKSFTMKYPKIQPLLNSHFIRGYFDGDGSLIYVKNMPKFTIVGSSQTIHSIQELFNEQLGIKKTKTVLVSENKNGSVIRMHCGGSIKIKKITDYLYSESDSTNRLNRKYLEYCKLEEYIRKSKTKSDDSRKRGILCQYDLNGNLINTWETALKASKELNIECSQIAKAVHCAKGYENNKYKGFKWKRIY